MEAQQTVTEDIFNEYTKSLYFYEDNPEMIMEAKRDVLIIIKLTDLAKESNYNILKHNNKEKGSYLDDIHELSLIINKEKKQWTDRDQLKQSATRIFR